ncbi:MAG: sigma-E factor negative regulatory protein [Methylococcaceae bacterium]
MSEDLNQKISQFLDNEIDPVDALSLLKKMRSQPELQDKLKRYEMISHAMKADAFLLTKTDFSTKIQQQIQQEPVYLLPQQRKRFKPSHKQVALAASFVIVAVIVGRSMNDPDQPFKAASALQVAQQPLPEKLVNSVELPQNQLKKRINDYLQAHNSSVYTNGEADFQPFARVATYSQK